MSKRILRSISIILVSVFLVSAPVHAFAAEARASAWLSGYSASIEASGNGILNIKFRVVGTGTMTKLRKNEEVAMSVLLRICEYLNCNIGDICDAVKTDNSEGEK